MVRSSISRKQGSGGGNRRDPAWKYGDEVEKSNASGPKTYVYIKCRFCGKVIKGGVKRMKEHLAGSHKGVIHCSKVTEDVKQEIQDYLKQGEFKRQIAQESFENVVSMGRYFGNVGWSSEEVGLKPGMALRASTRGKGVSLTSRGIRGPMDRFFLVNGDEEEGLKDGEAGKEKETINVALRNPKEFREQVCLDIGRLFFENVIPFNVVQSPSFIYMLRSVGEHGRGFKPPSMYELHSWILKEHVKSVDTSIEAIKALWATTGVTIMSDGWTDVRGRHLVNFLVNNPSGAVFLKSIDASAAIKDHKLFMMLLDDVVEEVGEEHVVQIVTDNASAYKLAGEKLMEKRKHLYWTPCAAHCIDLMLEKIGKLPQHTSALAKAKRVCNFIYGHVWVLALMRSFTKRELIRPTATRFATAYLTLESMMQNKQPLEAMFTSEKWVNCGWAKKLKGKAIRHIILKDKTLWPHVAFAIKSTQPLVNVLRMVDADNEPAMGFIYGAMDATKEEIAKNLGGDENKYKQIWEIIDQKWDAQLHKDLHAAAYFLNPQYQYDPNFSTHSKVTLGLYKCMERLIVDPEEREQAHLQLDDFRNKNGFFQFPLAMKTLKKRPPANWWTSFGDGTPALKKFAVKVLSLTCTSSACERNWSTFNQVHTKRRNCLDQSRMNALVYIMYNKRLKERHFKLKNTIEVDPLVVDTVSSDDEWLVEQPDEGQEDPMIPLSSTWREDIDLGISAINITEDALVGHSASTTSKGRTPQSTTTTTYKRRAKSTSHYPKGTMDKEKQPMELVDEEDGDFDSNNETEGEDDRDIRYDDCSMDDPTSDDRDDMGVGEEEL